MSCVTYFLNCCPPVVQVTVGVVRRQGSAGQVRVFYTTYSGSALASPSTDALFMGTSGWLTYIDGGLSTQTVSINIIDNGRLEGPVIFYVNLTQIQLIQPRFAFILSFKLLVSHAFFECLIIRSFKCRFMVE